MKLVVRFLIKRWRRVLVTLFGSLLAGAAVNRSRHRHVEELDTDTGPIVQELTLREKLKNRKRPKNGGGFSATPTSSSTKRQHIAHRAQPEKRTPIPPPPRRDTSKNVAKTTQRTKDLGGPDRGLTRDLRRG